MPRRVTIREVAQAAGVSTQTVSRVLNYRPDVAPDTVARVREVIAELSYSPNLLARGLTQGRTHLLGVVAYGLEYFGPSRIITGIEQQAAAMGYTISLTLIHGPRPTTLMPCWRTSWAAGWTASCGPSPRSPTTGPGCARAATTCRCRSCSWAAPPARTADPRSGSTTRPWDGSPPITSSPGVPEASPSSPARSIGGRRRNARLAGDALSRRPGVTPDDSLVTEGDWTASSGEEGLYRLLRSAPGIDAVFASNDQMALGVLHAAHRMGLRIPEDLAVVGVDDIAEGSHFWPPLTTVHQPLIDAGMMAVQTVVRLIRATTPGRQSDEPTTPMATVLQPELIVRQSSRAVSAATTRDRPIGRGIDTSSTAHAGARAQADGIRLMLSWRCSGRRAVGVVGLRA